MANPAIRRHPGDRRSASAYFGRPTHFALERLVPLSPQSKK